jgi:hypothetical protein
MTNIEINELISVLEKIRAEQHPDSRYRECGIFLSGRQDKGTA